MNFLEVLMESALKSALVIALAYLAILVFKPNPRDSRAIWVAAFLLIGLLTVLAYLRPGSNVVALFRGVPAWPEVKTPGLPGPEVPGPLLTIWVTGATGLSVALIMGFLRLSNLQRNSYLPDWAPPGRYPVFVARNPRLTVPLAYGIWRPRILLPRDAEEWTGEARTAIIAHERRHLDSRDPLVLLFVQAVCIFHWFNPLMWFAFFRLKMECERICDHDALSTGIKPSSYAQLLLDLAVADRPHWTATAAPSFMRGKDLALRVRHLLNNLDSFERPRIYRCALGFMCLLTVAILANTRTVAQVQTQLDASTSSSVPLISADEKRAIERRLRKEQIPPVSES